MFNVRDFGVVLTIIVLIAFYIPLSLHYIWKLYSKTYLVKQAEDVQSCVFLQQRYSSLSLMASIAYLIQFFDLSLWIFVYSDWYNKQKYQSILISISSSLHITTQFIITLSLTLRFWLIHFRMKFEMMAENHGWKKIINSKYINDEQKNTEHAMYDIMTQMQSRINSTAFVLKYKSTLGNYRWCFRRAVCILILLLIMLISAEYINYNPYELFPAKFGWIQLAISALIYGAFGVLWSILLFLHCRSPDFNDSLYIRKELSNILQTMMFFLIIYIVFIVVFGLGLSNSNVYEDHFFNEIIILFHVIAFSNMLMLYVIIFYPLQKSLAFSRMSVREHSETSKDREFSVEMTLSKTKRAESPRAVPKKMKIEHVLRNKFGYVLAFIQHLSSEFSMENLLSVTEFLQFKLYIHRNYKESVMNKELRYWLYMLPLDALPRSEIVYFGETKAKISKKRSVNDKKNLKLLRQISASSAGSLSGDNEPQSQQIQEIQSEIEVNELDAKEFLSEIKLKAYNLYFKYIRIGSEHEINISYELRSRYKYLFENKEEWLNGNKMNDLSQMRDIFDDCCLIMKRLMRHSFNRFKNGKLFEKVKEKIDRK